MRNLKTTLAVLCTITLAASGLQMPAVSIQAKEYETVQEKVTEEEIAAEETTTEEVATEEVATDETTTEEVQELIENETSEQEAQKELTENFSNQETSKINELTVRTVKSDNTAVMTAITSVEYDIDVEGVKEEKVLKWHSQDSNWSEHLTEISLDGNGNYQFLQTYSSVDGFKNLGYMETIDDSEIKVTLRKIVVNETYELTFEEEKVLQVGTSWNNGLPNIWSGLDDKALVCGNEDAYLAMNSADSLISFYILQEQSGEDKKDEGDIEDKTDADETAISKVSFQVNVSQITDETAFEWSATDANWGEQTTKVDISNGEGTYTFSQEYSQVSGMINLGYVKKQDNSNMTIQIEKVTLNDEYELIFDEDKILYVGTDYNNGLPNIWSGLADGAKICGSDNAYLAFDQKDSLIKFYLMNQKTDDSKEDTSDASLKYVEAMGYGWNLGNSFDAVDSDLNVPDKGEESWGNPIVTRELIKQAKKKGYQSIRIPMTVYHRYSVNEQATDGEYKYVIDKEWLARYKEVVDWAVEDGFYVMINVHHDSWLWLSEWNGDTSAKEYEMFTDFWKQIAEYFKDEPEQVCFETINEPTFTATGNISAQDKLDEINRAAYNIIRGIKENETRMIVMPTLDTNHEKCAPLVKLIQELDDDYIIATVHYYSEWVYSANLGKTSFDEALWDDYTARKSADSFVQTLNQQFINKGIGVIVGEYGLLGYDAYDECLQEGEELKYYEYIGEKARQNNICFVFWDNGSGIDRYTYEWKKDLVGEMLETSMKERSAYSTGLDTLYYNEQVEADVEIELTLNGNTFKGVKGLTQGKDYTYNSDSNTLILKKEFVNGKFEECEGYGTFAELVLQFSAGADWHQYLVKYGTPVAKASAGTRDKIVIPVDFNGADVRRATAYEVSGKVGPNSSWWNYLQNGGAYTVDKSAGKITFTSGLFSDETVKDGLMKIVIEYFDGQTSEIWLKIEGNTVTSSSKYKVDLEEIDASQIICLYAGETAIPSQYINAPEGTSVYGTWVDDSSIVTLTGWPAVLKFDTKAHENFTNGGIVLYYMNVEKYVDVSFGIKDAPVVENLQLTAGQTGNLEISNIDKDAKLVYHSDDTAVATVDANGKVTAKKAGSAMVTVSITQYNRTDDFKTTILVKGGNTSSDSDKQQNSGTNNDTSAGQTSSTQTTSGKNTTNASKDTNKITSKVIDNVEVPMAQPVTGTESENNKTDTNAVAKTEIKGTMNKETVKTEEKITVEAENQEALEEKETAVDSDILENASEEVLENQTEEKQELTTENTIEEEAIPASATANTGFPLKILLVVVVAAVILGAGAIAIILNRRNA